MRLTKIRSARKARDPTDEEVDAVIARFPDGAPPAAIAEVLGVSAQRVEQIVAIALEKVRAAATARGLMTVADFLD